MEGDAPYAPKKRRTTVPLPVAFSLPSTATSACFVYAVCFCATPCFRLPSAAAGNYEFFLLCKKNSLLLGTTAFRGGASNDELTSLNISSGGIPC
ncbi:MAG: hypothetical protein ACTTH8_01365 [Treponema sp.]